VAARWAIGFWGEEKLSPATRRIYAKLSEIIPPPGEDQDLSPVLGQVAELIQKGGIESYGL